MTIARSAVLAALGVLACSPTEYSCRERAQCARGDAQGQCEPNGWCAYRDPECPSALRYGTQAGDGLAGTCVPPGDDGSSGGSGGGGSSSGNSSGGGSSGTGVESAR